MNQANMNVHAKKSAGAGIPSNRPPHITRNRPDPKILALMRGIMLILCAAIVLTGFLLLVLPMFRVKTIEVVGNSYYTAEEIIEPSKIKAGDEILVLDLDSASQQILDTCAYVSTVKVVRYPFKVKIVIKERENVTVTEHDGKYYTLSDHLLVLEESDSAEAFKGFPTVILPEIERLSVGEYVSFQKDSVDLSYLYELIDSLKEGDRYADVARIDCSQKFNVSYVVGEKFRIELGAIDDIEAKLELAELIIARKGTEAEACAVVNVSNLKKPTFRTVGTTEMLLG